MPELNEHSRRRIEALAARLRYGEVKGFIFRPLTMRLRGRDASMGFSRKGRIADYSPVMSHVLRDAVFRNKEVSPRFDLVLALSFTGEPAFDERIEDVARYWSYLVTRCLGGAIAIIPENGGKFRYAAPVRDWLGASREIANLHQTALAPARAPAEKLRAFSGSIAAFYEGAHLVVIGPYWEPAEAVAYARAQLYGSTFCMIETGKLGGSGFFGDVFPHSLIEQHLLQRRLRLIATCKRLRANCLVFPGNAEVTDSFIRGIAGSNIL